jgi:hypothetical protein
VADTAARDAIRKGWAEEAESDTSLSDDMGEMKSRLEYGEFLADPRNPLLDYEEWKAKRPVPTNPATKDYGDCL